ncbi:RteC domain-containing protein [Pedobacter paludis]|uniref:RteC protein n=1 Tax=Pedobacter paludis TaxID=2203212 RepID=A0A317F3C3_9SPHI|nr:RteC domain-containing protein [Pedobacter paludis]PWS33335.1 hypothetical protein DF947_01540 [Pedobacter paludis]
MMQKSYEDLFAAFGAALAKVDGDFIDELESFPSAMEVCQDYLKLLKELFVRQEGIDEAFEIVFFKSVKPRFYAERMYRFERYQLALNRPVGRDAVVRLYLEEELSVLERFLESYRMQYLYFKTKGDELDGVYFLRSGKLPQSMLAGEWDADREYSTGMDYLFAKFMAFGRMREFILSELALLPVVDLVKGSGIRGFTGAGKRFAWTGEVINLVELGYGLWLSGQLDSGKAGLMEIFRWLEQSFGLEIGIPANRFREIRRRKRISRTHFMELCQARLLEYMDEDDVFVADGEKIKRRGFR